MSAINEFYFYQFIYNMTMNWKFHLSHCLTLQNCFRNILSLPFVLIDSEDLSYDSYSRGHFDSKLGPDRLAGPMALDPNHCRQQTLRLYDLCLKSFSYTSMQGLRVNNSHITTHKCTHTHTCTYSHKAIKRWFSNQGLKNVINWDAFFTQPMCVCVCVLNCYIFCFDLTP